MKTRSINDLAKGVLSKLRIIDATEEPEQHDANAVKAKYEEKYTELADKGLAYWVEEEIPLPVYDHVVGYVANAIGPEFGHPFDPNAAGYLERELRKHVARSSSRQTIPTEYF